MYKKRMRFALDEYNNHLCEFVKLDDLRVQNFNKYVTFDRED